MVERWDRGLSDPAHPTPLILCDRVSCQKNRSFARLRVQERRCSYKCSRLHEEKVPVDRTEIAQLKIGDIPDGGAAADTRWRR